MSNKKLTVFDLVIDRINMLNLELWFYFRVAIAQRKRGIWMLTFSDGENTGNLGATRKIEATQGKL